MSLKVENLEVVVIVVFFFWGGGGVVEFGFEIFLPYSS